MKKIINALFLLAIGVMTFSSCSDVPAPYDTPNQNDNNPTKPITAEPAGSGTETSPPRLSCSQP